MAEHRSWKEFEAVITRLQKSFASTGKVTRNERIQGMVSGTKRQIDIAIRTDVGTEQLLIIVECKRWNRKPDVKAIEAFAGVKQDVRANAAIMISTKGFSKAAFKTAKAEGISLYQYEDTLTPGWPNGLVTHVMLEIWELTPCVAQLICKDGTIENVNDEHDIFDSLSGETMVMATLLRKTWDDLANSERYDRSWMVELKCTCQERPEVSGIILGAISRRITGYREGRLQFEGLINEMSGIAKVDGWKMVFEDKFTPLAQGNIPHSETVQVVLKATHVKTLDPVSEGKIKLIYDGVLEISVQHKSVTDLPVSKMAQGVGRL